MFRVFNQTINARRFLSNFIRFFPALNERQQDIETCRGGQGAVIGAFRGVGLGVGLELLSDRVHGWIIP